MAHQRDQLPQKICTHCGLPFRWRKRWARNWDEIRYCSERCRRNRGRKPAAEAGKNHDN
ncbi:MAG: DUF2256 domain-containing protein [Planctomycetaceae bacterium]